LSSAESTPAERNSSSVKKEIASTPSRRFRQNSSILRAPGKRPAMPTMAIPLTSSKISALLIALSSHRCTLRCSLAPLHQLLAQVRLFAARVRKFGALCFAQMFRKRMDRGVFEQVDYLDVSVQSRAQFAVDLREQQRVAPEIEKVAVNAHSFHVEDLLPNGGDRLLQIAFRRHVSLFAFGQKLFGIGQRAPVQLAVR